MADEALLSKIDEKAVIAEKGSTKQGLRDVGDPELVREDILRRESDPYFPAAVRPDRRSIHCDEIGGTGRRTVGRRGWKDALIGAGVDEEIAF